jgi:hypothetical protein
LQSGEWMAGIALNTQDFGGHLQLFTAFALDFK